MARRDVRDAPAPRVRAGRHPGAYRGLGGAAVRALDAGHQLDERAAGGLLFVPEGTDEGAADRLGGDSQGGCGGLLLAAHTGYKQVYDAPLGVGAVGADAVEQACGTGGQLGEVVVVRADADAADGGASLRLLDGQAPPVQSVVLTAPSAPAKRGMLSSPIPMPTQKPLSRAAISAACSASLARSKAP